MRVLCSPLGTVFDPKRPEQGIRDIVDAGFDGTVLDGRMYCNADEYRDVERSRKNASANKRPFLPDRPEEFRTVAEPFATTCRGRGLSMPILQAPILWRGVGHSSMNDSCRALVLASVKKAVDSGCDHVIVSPLFAGIPYASLWEENKAFYLELMKACENTDLRILVENYYVDHEGHAVRGFLSDASMAAGFVRELNEATGSDRFGFCLDVGVCNLCGEDMYEVVTGLGDTLSAVILRDGNGQVEASLLPFTAIENYGQQTDWLSLIRGLRQIRFDGDLILEAGETLGAVSPLLRPSYMKIAKETADYIAWQIGIEKTLRKYKHIVLFGAGNMCRNYLMNYGDQYPPLFTCDNNKARWGEDFFGLTIHDPKDLLDLPEDTGIFICNVYYREIEDQLLKMGITAGIEYFNDEYLPVLNMNRLKGL